MPWRNAPTCPQTEYSESQESGPFPVLHLAAFPSRRLLQAFLHCVGRNSLPVLLQSAHRLASSPWPVPGPMNAPETSSIHQRQQNLPRNSPQRGSGSSHACVSSRASQAQPASHLSPDARSRCPSSGARGTNWPGGVSQRAERGGAAAATAPGVLPRHREGNEEGRGRWQQATGG